MSIEEAIKNLDIMLDSAQRRTRRNIVIPDLIEAIEMAVEALKEQIDRRWIPCSERLPEEDDVKNVLVTVNKRYALYDVILLPSKSVKTEYKMGHIDAWMPLPEPYREEASE